MTPPPPTPPPCGPEPGLFWDGTQRSVAPFTFPTYHIPTPLCLPFATFAPLLLTTSIGSTLSILIPLCSTTLL